MHLLKICGALGNTEYAILKVISKSYTISKELMTTSLCMLLCLENLINKHLINRILCLCSKHLDYSCKAPSLLVLLPIEGFCFYYVSKT